MDFRARYRRECLLTDTAPLHVIESSLGNSSLKFNFFRVPPPEWGPLLASIESDITLKKISIIIDYNEYTVNNPTHQLKLKHLPALITSLSYHISNNANLLDLSLNGIPLSDEAVDSLIEGLLHSKSLQHLSLSSCKLSNDQAMKILGTVEKKPRLVWLELCSCGLTSRCKQGLFNLIHSQTVARENAAWKASLRQESASLELMGGLRRLSLSDNDLGDAIDQLTLALSQDNCLKALDLQFCQLENSQLEMLIEVTTKNPALVFIDVTNNNGLDATLVKELQNTLKSKVINEADCPFTPFSVTKQAGVPPSSHEKRYQAPNADSKRPVSTPANSKRTPMQSVKKKILLKSANPPVKPNSTQREESPKKHTKQSTNDVDDSLKNIREELRRERELRLDAERQVIKIYAEMETAWLKITKLEKEVKKLKKQKATLMSGTSAFPMSYNHPSPLLVDQPTLKDFHTCLGQLRTILQRLSWNPALSQDASGPQNAKANGIEGILKNLHSAVNDLALSVNIPEREKEPLQSIDPFKHSHQQALYSKNYESRIALQRSKPEAFHSNIQRSYDQRLLSDCIDKKSVREEHNAPSTLGAHEGRSPFQETRGNGTKAVTGHRNFTSTPLSGCSVPIRKPQMSPSVLIPSSTNQILERELTQATQGARPPRSDSFPSSSHSLIEKNTNSIQSFKSSNVKERRNEVDLKEAEFNSDRNVPKERITSLKSIQNNLEGFLQQLTAKETEPMEMSRYANSLLPANDGVSVSEEGNVRNEKSEYSMDFDSTATSIRTISNELKKLSRNGTPSFNSIHAEEKISGASQKAKERRSKSRSSSTLNLSSIVDLLGDFSVGDIGSSTLTPP